MIDELACIMQLHKSRYFTRFQRQIRVNERLSVFHKNNKAAVKKFIQNKIL